MFKRHIKIQFPMCSHTECEHTSRIYDFRYNTKVCSKQPLDRPKNCLLSDEEYSKMKMLDMKGMDKIKKKYEGRVYHVEF